MHGFEAAARQEKSEKGSIICCLFIAAFLMPKGKNLMKMFAEAPFYLYPDVSHSISPTIVEGFNALTDPYESQKTSAFC